MSRYTGPRLHVMRALGVELPGLSTRKLERRPHPPGQHGQARKRKPSDYALRLKEKQKLRFHYGVSERQLRKIFAEASSSRVPTGTRLAQLLETRLDNILFRAGFAATIPAARQQVTHGHVLVNGRRLDIPSARLAKGDVITLHPKSRGYADREGAPPHTLQVPQWLSVDRTLAQTKLMDSPDSESIPFSVELRLIIEFYAR